MLAALVFNKLFFPSFDPLAGTMLAFSTFAVGYPVAARRRNDVRSSRRSLRPPLRAGGDAADDGRDHRADRPAADVCEIGVLAPILLVSLRFVQGTALGGEWAGAVLLSVEHGDERHAVATPRGRRWVLRSARCSRPARWRSPRFCREASCWPGAGACRCSPACCWWPSDCGCAWAWPRRRCSAARAAGARRTRRSRSVARSLARLLVGWRRAHRSGRHVLVGRCVLAHLHDHDTGSVAHARVDGAVHRRGVQCGARS